MNLSLVRKEPYRLFFPLAFVFLLAGAGVWLPQIWARGESYPVEAHKYFMLNGFAGCLLAGLVWQRFSLDSFLIPASFLLVTFTGVLFVSHEETGAIVGTLEGGLLLGSCFLARGNMKPPWFLCLGMILWMIATGGGMFMENELLESVQYEGALTLFLLWWSQSPETENGPIVLGAIFCGTYILPASMGSWLRAGLVAYWFTPGLSFSGEGIEKCHSLASLMIIFSYVVSAIWKDGGIHASHNLFIGGVVVQSGLAAFKIYKPKWSENKGGYWFTGILILAALTRSSAILLPKQYLSHLGYSAFLLFLAAGILLRSIVTEKRS